MVTWIMLETIVRILTVFAKHVFHNLNKKPTKLWICRFLVGHAHNSITPITEGSISRLLELSTTLSNFQYASN